MNTVQFPIWQGYYIIIKKKYFLNATFRDDGSSQIPTANRYQDFWAVGAAWDISKEDFMKDQTVVDFLKLKGSIGVLGNQSTPDTHQPEHLSITHSTLT